MRIYIIGNDGITLCREPPATIDNGEIAVTSREELHAARLSAFIAVDLPDGEGRREVNNDIDCVSGRAGEPDPAMAGTERTSSIRV